MIKGKKWRLVKMKKIFSKVVAGALVLCMATLSLSIPSKADNPIVQNIYTADPAPMVSGDTLYLYTSHDEDKLVKNFYTMNDWKCYSTKDMVNWTDHGTVLSRDNFKWMDILVLGHHSVLREMANFICMYRFIKRMVVWLLV